MLRLGERQSCYAHARTYCTHDGCPAQVPAERPEGLGGRLVCFEDVNSRPCNALQENETF